MNLGKMMGSATENILVIIMIQLNKWHLLDILVLGLMILSIIKEKLCQIHNLIDMLCNFYKSICFIFILKFIMLK